MANKHLIALTCGVILAASGTAAPAQLPAVQDRPLSAPERIRLASLEVQFTRISAQRNTSVAALRTIARAMGTRLTTQDPDQILKTVDERAQELSHARDQIGILENQLETLDSTRLARAVSPLLGQAKAAISEGRLGDAEAALKEAGERFAQARTNLQGSVDKLASQEADIDVQRAGVRSALFDYRGAADLYAKAAEVTPAADVSVRWRYRLAQAAALVTFGQENADAAKEAATLLTDVVLPLAPQGERPADWAATQTVLAKTWREIGGRSGDNAALGRAIAALRSALDLKAPGEDPAARLERQVLLASTLSMLGEREGSAPRLAEAVAGFKDAFAARPPDQPLYYSEYGSALGRLGFKLNDTNYMRQAVEQLRAGAAHADRVKMPRTYAMLQLNAAFSLYMLGDKTADVAALEQSNAIAAEGLRAIDPQLFPQIWAGLRRRLGYNLVTISRMKGPSHAAEATEGIRILREAAEQLTRERSPTNWAAIQDDLADGYKLLAERAAGTAELEQEIAARRLNCSVFTAEVSPQYWNDGQLHISAALIEMARRSTGQARTHWLQEARSVIDQAVVTAATLSDKSDLDKLKANATIVSAALDRGAAIPARGPD